MLGRRGKTRGILILGALEEEKEVGPDTGGEDDMGEMLREDCRVIAQDR